MWTKSQRFFFEGFFFILNLYRVTFNNNCSVCFVIESALSQVIKSIFVKLVFFSMSFDNIRINKKNLQKLSIVKRFESISSVNNGRLRKKFSCVTICTHTLRFCIVALSSRVEFFKRLVTYLLLLLYIILRFFRPVNKTIKENKTF